ncbi:polyphosphate glucokinase [Deinobacterium chartae]|uniref:Polyphosphate glucokinase n=1 Tax=Deinobacterium chartae TaxID=521158 RepID=A0A841I2Z3_9DEIO|nr:ROK family protein [Deinobacterium chartae]MBB6098739.1 polyphosphate glucokinase [Deinobacterium chartae]
MPSPTEILGIDIGGSGIKGAPVRLADGSLALERHRIATPQPSSPQAVAAVVAQLVRHFDWHGPVGCTFPAIIKGGVAHSAANVDKAWIGTDAAALFAETTGCPVAVLNDADAAGVAEATHGAARGRQGTVLLLTFGTGIGSALLLDGKLVPNTELGHLELDGREAEAYASDRVREIEDLSWKNWGKRVSRYLRHLEFLFSPDLFVFGGGVSKKWDKFAPYLEVQTEIKPAVLRNEAGMVGAAMAAATLGCAVPGGTEHAG